MPESKFQQELAAQRASRNAKQLNLDNLNMGEKNTRILTAWGMPSVGRVLERDGMERWVGWQGEPNPNSDVALLVARIGVGQEIEVGSFWAFGATSADELAMSGNPDQVVLDAAYLIHTPSGTNRNLSLVIEALCELVPPRY